MARNSSQLAIPLVLPNNCTWNERTGEYFKKDGVERKTLDVMQEALDKLSEIKGPVCVISIAGTCRKGKSYILSNMFDQGEVFPLGHSMTPETMGIWLWVVPQKFKDSTGRDFTVVLLDSEGIDACSGIQSEDHKIFTLSVLLSSILIYNSTGVPHKTDLDALHFIVKLSERIQLREPRGTDKDEKHFYETFPNFIWLLRDVVLRLPADCSNTKEYFEKKVLNANNEELNEDGRKTAESILAFFSGFDAFSLPPPSYDPDVLEKLVDKSLESQVNPQFLKEVEEFKKKLHSKLAPKKSINEREFVTGEALAALIQLFVEALNTPGTVPNVENAWDTFVQNKCMKVLAAALTKYKEEMTSEMKDKIPCEADTIRAEHDNAMQAGLETFKRETFDLSLQSVDEYLKDFQIKTKSCMEGWLEENKRRTEGYCRDLFRNLKQKYLNPVLVRIGGPDAVKVNFDDLTKAYNKIEEEYKMAACGAKDVQTTVFMNGIQELGDEMKQHKDFLSKMKDYDEEVAVEKAKMVVAENEISKYKEKMDALEDKKKNMESEMKVVSEKCEEDVKRIKQVAEQNLKDQRQQIENAKNARFNQLETQRSQAIQENQKLQQRLKQIELEKSEAIQENRNLQQTVNRTEKTYSAREGEKHDQQMVNTTNAPLKQLEPEKSEAIQGNRNLQQTVNRLEEIHNERVRKYREVKSEIEENSGVIDILVPMAGLVTGIAVAALAPVAPITAAMAGGMQAAATTVITIASKCSIM